ncbi:carbohydrate kinase family protein [Roseobacter sp. EG26]|uniref:carbohydrate kinase family protein n=1 Tax=Roseobacter sp. EG26 TaxID=3412477 RepID=UPI003CE48583
MPRILCAGLIAADLVFEVGEFPASGTKIRARGARMIAGGGAMNAASAITSLGGEAILAGAIGDDPLGEFLSDRIKAHGIDDHLVQKVAGASTPRSAIVITADGERTIINHRDAEPPGETEALHPDLLFDAVLVDTRFPALARTVTAAARQAGKPCIVDAEAPVSIATEVLEDATHVIFSEQGLADFCGEVSAAALAHAARQLGGWCAVTRGARPVLCCDGQHSTKVTTLKTHARNTLGAGDVWHGAFTLALTRGHSEIEAVHWANAAAALKVSRPLQMEDLPTTAEVESLLQSDKPALEQLT